MNLPSLDLLEALAETRLLAIIRGSDPDACVNTALTLINTGVTVLEVSLTSKDALETIRRIAAAASGSAVIGAGTVLTEVQTLEALDAGAQFIVTPGLAPSVDTASRLGVPLLVGALTPTEVLQAIERGASAVKLFPASLGGPGYLKALRDPFPDIHFIPVGGVDVDSVSSYLQSGALAVGAGSPLTGDAPDGGSLAALQGRAASFLRLTDSGLAESGLAESPRTVAGGSAASGRPMEERQWTS
ncbi:bifunctional 4-hydroxy-2-oxoglutarate aldolase/2-dehydro-3-deoxy-phosphogluconate aldolase [Arthrobacter sp. ISL-30]|uniref:bifunctional 4-hydroxy-2-oxoglutarate aldolase/2-dehydro-3-deoxy-phosphogluconate aldolase n=1 Tax=Arthrobacter sp. ISL-30 TaxID=2819109 RepID=UPI001BEA63C4|nr:bifunctional 4-hydroxy-2-oxoglutarate aldolase/2-dehydro-3-deoxy-phosphogluconate aldolase [Arthrobacter sp. ISL-30]MBT2513690.1 bifunctional 4-hydroxy-2-oxoglutarate aldolase/2-dehydro-3-deoxy-phosphogluconate aldolase [Arthrobacter sp. ISL-30]